jgi:hypothetical protein
MAALTGTFTGYQPTLTVNDNRCNILWTATSGTMPIATNATDTNGWFVRNPQITTNSITASRIYYTVNTFANQGTTTYVEGPTTYYAQGTAGTTYIAQGNNVQFRFITTTEGYAVPVPKTAGDRLREILDTRMAPNIISSCRPLGFTKDEREMRARETLRRVLGEQKFKDFIRRGSISVRAKSGKVYQIFPGHDFTKVYDSGKLVDRLCVVLQGNFPPTDSLIMRYLMILNNEKQFRSYAIKHGVSTPTLPITPDQRSLVEIFKELKQAA